MALVEVTAGTKTVPLDAALFDGLKPLLRGPLLLPAHGDAGYDDARSIWNAMIDRRPAAVIRCLGVADVVAGVRFARDAALPVAIKAGGHNISGLAVGEGSLMLDLSAMRGVLVDPAERIAHAQGGCLLGDIDRETQLHGLAAVMGFVSATGAAGVTLGGGVGYISRRFGWTSDNVLSMQMVTADGRIVRASERENADLFWGLRGGGGNFGVVVDFEHRLHPLGPEIVGGAIAWRAEDAGEVMELYLELMAEAPPEMAVVFGLRNAPPAPWIAKEMHGKPIVALFVCHTGPVTQAEKDVARIKSFGKPVGDVVQKRTYVAQQSLLDATQPKGRRYYWKSEYLPGVTRELLQAAIQHAQNITSPHSAILVFPLGGAVKRLPEDHSAVGNRDAEALFNIAGAWENAEDDATHVEWARATWRDLKRFSTGGTYVNFLTEEEGDDRIRAAYGKNYDRLVDIKTKWDPANLFRMNKNIVPRGA
jgi:FAD/FMN-containing dehydrogenase